MKTRREEAHKALDVFIARDRELNEAKWEWYLAEYEGKFINDGVVSKPGQITTEQLESVVRRYGRAIAFRYAAKHTLTDMLGL